MDAAISTDERETAPADRPYLVLGLDPGIASCGFCLLDMTNHRILEMGSHLFDTPQEPKTKTSLAVKRRSARSMRRNIKRTRDRLSHALALFKNEGIVPAEAQKQWFQPLKGEKPVLKLRAAGLDHLLSGRAWAQVLYSLCSRRGYIPHGEGSVDEVGASSEDGKVLAAIKSNNAIMAQRGFRTVGEMLASQGKSRNKSGAYDLCVTNAQIVDEAHTLFERQRALGSEHAGEAFEQAYLACLTWQKPMLEHDQRVYDLVGPCSYFPELKRAADADVTSEMLRAQERLAHVVIVDPTGTELAIPFETRQRFMDILFSAKPLPKNAKCEVKYTDIRKALDLHARSSFKGINADDEKKEVFSPKAWRAYRKAGLSPELLERMRDDRELGDGIGEALTFASTEQSLRARLEELDLEDSEIEQVMKVPFSSKIFKGYGSRSIKAQSMLLDAFEDERILKLTDAEDATGLLQLRLSDTNARDTLLKPYIAYDPTCRNPVVLRALSRMRRIVNAIIREHGVPDVIRVELGRELKQSQKEKDAISKANNRNEKERKRVAELVAGVLGIEPGEVKSSVIRKYLMWEEQEGHDAYTGAKIDSERLMRDSSYCQIDHVLPYSRTCDDSRMNKVLVLAKSNQDKRERTPYEWMTSGEAGAPDWDAFRARVQESKLPAKKKEHLLEQDLPSKEKGFIERNLNDDRYMSRAVKNYLEDSLLFPEDRGDVRHVYAVAGGATANLRHSWGLNFGEGNAKDREDDRHHAVDAAVIAACDASAVIKLAHMSEQRHKVPKEDRDALLAGIQPWEGFADAVREVRDLVVPTRMVDHGVTGQAFEETLYRFDGVREDGKGNLFLKKGSKPSGNYMVDDEGNAHIVGGVAFLRLWLDPNARPTGKVKGQWYGEPVYYADLPAIKAGTYVPRYMKAHSSRPAWPVVPQEAMVREPVALFSGDVISVNGKIGRLNSVNIDNGAWQVLDAVTGQKISSWPTIGSLGRDDDVHVIEEDVLGRCYYRLP